jgi:hypothetical protein
VAITGIIGAMLSILSCGNKNVPSVIGEWKVVRIDRTTYNHTPPEILNFKPDGTFEGWFYNSDGLYKASGTWVRKIEGSEVTVKLLLTNIEGRPEITLDVRRSEIVHTWYGPGDEVVWRRL